MGQLSTKVVDEARQRSVEDERTANDALNSLFQIAEDKLKLFRTYVEGGTDSKEIPIEKVIDSDQFIRCSVDSSDATLKDTVKSMVNNVAHGDFVAAIADSAVLAVDALLGSYAGNVSQKQLYKVVVGRFGGIQRIDFMLYSYRYTSQSLISVTKNVVVCSMIVSSVASKDVSLDTLRVILQNNYPTEPIETLQKLFDLIKEQKAAGAGLGHNAIAAVHTLIRPTAAITRGSEAVGEESKV